MSCEPLFAIKDGEKRYGQHIALRVPDFEIVQGDRIIVSGENGAGKSTLLRIVAGMTEMKSGVLHRSAQWHDLSIGYLPQDGGIYRDLTVAENQRAFRRLLGSPRDPGRSEVLAERLGVTDILRKGVNELSGGFRRLAALYALLSSGANALVLDEPFTSLDGGKQLAVRDAFRSLASKFRVLVVSEHLDHAPELTESSPWSKALWLKRHTSSEHPKA
jgi:ABC-type multidrug transport system ATPase subunit